jgi:multicomponent Na+:H+ antiporter subunit B
VSRQARLLVFLAGAGGMAAAFLLAFVAMPAFGSHFHPYRNLAVPAAVARRTANAVSSVNFDLRGIDTLGEETILLASVLGAAVILRPSHDEPRRSPSGGRVTSSTRLLGYVFLPVTLVIALDVIAHGHVTPGGGFQGGVILGTGIHLLYVSASYQVLEKVRPLDAFEWFESLGTGAFAGLGVAALVTTGAFLANIVGYGSFGELLSAGTVPILNGAVGVAVASGTVILLASFLDRDMHTPDTPEPANEDGQ